MNHLLESLLERGALKGCCTAHNTVGLFMIRPRRASHSAPFNKYRLYSFKGEGGMYFANIIIYEPAFLKVGSGYSVRVRIPNSYALSSLPHAHERRKSGLGLKKKKKSE